MTPYLPKRSFSCFSLAFIPETTTLLAFVRNDGAASAGLPSPCWWAACPMFLLDYLFIFPLDMGNLRRCAGHGGSPLSSVWPSCCFHRLRRRNGLSTTGSGPGSIGKTARAHLLSGLPLPGSTELSLRASSCWCSITLMLVPAGQNVGVAAYGQSWANPGPWWSIGRSLPGVAPGGPAPHQAGPTARAGRDLARRVLGSRP